MPGTLFFCLRFLTPQLCWGNDDYGQASPLEGETFAAISSGFNHTCGLLEDDAAVCWGAHYDLDGASSPPEGEIFAAVSTGNGHRKAAGCYEKDGSAVCWGLTRPGRPARLAPLRRQERQ